MDKALVEQKDKKSLVSLFIHLFLLLALFLGTFLVYLHNLSFNVYGGDAGDFLSAIAVKGVPHPSGYPLYTLLGILMGFLPVDQPLAWKVGLLSSFFTSSAVVLTYLLVFEFLKSRLLSLITALSYAFVFPFFLYAEFPEVFALHFYLLLLQFYLAYLYWKENRVIYLCALMFSIGLGLANNELALLLIPALFILILRNLTLKKLIIALPFFLLGLTPYIYIPIAASHNPPVSWDNASTLPNFIRLVTRADYGWGGATSWTSYNVTLDTRMISLGRYFLYWLTNLPPLLFISFMGIIALLRKKKYVLLAALTSAYLFNGPLLNFLYAAAETNPFTLGTFERYYAISGIFLLLLFPFGISYFSQLISRLMKNRIAPLPIQVLFLSVPFVLFVSNFSRTDLHTLWIGDTFITDVLSPLPKNSYLLTDDDNVIFNGRYMQYAKGFRKDITIEIINSSNPLKKAIKKHTGYPIFVTSNVIDQQGSDAPDSIPYGLVLKVATDKDPILRKDEYHKKQGQLLAKLSKALMPAEKIAHLNFIALLPAHYSWAYIDTAKYFINHYQDNKIARQYLAKAIEIYPNNSIPYMGLVISYFQEGDCKNAVKYLDEILYTVRFHDPTSENYLKKMEDTINVIQQKCRYVLSGKDVNDLK